MFAVPHNFRACALAAGAAFAILAASAPARAGCQEDFQGMVAKREAIVAQLKNMTHGGKKQLDPVAACPKFRSLTAIVSGMLAYMEKNQNWCAVRDEDIEGAKKGRASLAKQTAQACGLAAKIGQMKKQAQQQATQGAAAQVQQLPHGPL